MSPVNHDAEEVKRLAKELVRLADILRDCNRLVSPGGTAEAVMRDAAAALASRSAPQQPANEREAFEAWAIEQWGRIEGVPDAAWLGWQGRAAIRVGAD